MPSFNISTEPENGTVVTFFEGSRNVTFTCNISDPISSEQQSIVWRSQNPDSNVSEFVYYSGIKLMFHAPDGSYKNNQLALHNFNTSLDGVTISCGTEYEMKLAFFTLKLNREFFSVSLLITLQLKFSLDKNFTQPTNPCITEIFVG